MTEKTILPPTYFWVALVVSLALHILVGGPAFISFPLSLIGIVPVVIGAVLNYWADHIFKIRGTTVKPYEKPSSLITEGPFGWCRHPMYLGMLAILFGASFLCGTVVSLVGPVLFWIIMRVRFLREEEQSMRSTFGDEYLQYRKKVHAWM
jgi:protein-S-isoprenylcysteine O-methyltransferase Ste14